MPIHDEQHWLSWWDMLKEEHKHKHCEKRSLLIQLLLLLAKSVCATAPSQKLAGGDCLRRYIIISGNTETHARMVWVFPFSADVIAYTLRRPSSATTLPGLWTTLTPVSSQL